MMDLDVECYIKEIMTLSLFGVSRYWWCHLLIRGNSELVLVWKKIRNLKFEMLVKPLSYVDLVIECLGLWAEGR